MLGDLNMRTISLGIGVFVASTVAAFATCVPECSVPEIDPLGGLAAMGVVGSIGALIWERQRRRKSPED